MVKFNEQQKLAIEFYKGACGVIAGAGSGKSTVLLNRIKNLIENKQINEKDILAISFTRNTADELKNKLSKMGYLDVNVGTFHSICGRILSQEGIYITGQNLIKEWQVENCFKTIEDKPDVDDIKSFISYQKNYMRGVKDQFVTKESNYHEDDLRQFYVAYEKFKDKNGLYDFDDYLLMCYEVLRGNPGKYTFDFILVDEHQDSNLVQNLLLKELCKSGNMFCVYDYRQCFPVGTKIRTETGMKNIEELIKNDKVSVASGRGNSINTELSEIVKKHYEGKLIEIKTESGYTMKATPNHTIFLNTLIKNKHFIYLMYREGFGFRIGRSSKITTSQKGKVLERNGYEKRLTDEKGSKVWLLRTCETLEDALYYENHYAFQYGIPLYVFNYKNRDGILSQEMITKLFNSINTIPRGFELLKDLNMSFDFPHYVPQANSTDLEGGRKRRLNFVMFGSNRKGVGVHSKYIGNNHELSFSTIDKEFADFSKTIFKSGVSKQVNGKGFEYHVGRKVSTDQDDLVRIIYDIEHGIKNVDVSYKAVLTNDTKVRFNFMPLMNAKIGMGVPVWKNGKIIEDKIIEINTHDYNGIVYDLNIDSYRNYIAGDIVVHNCIYAFRGGNPDYAMNFESEWENATIINLDTNYRSTENIVDNANKFIKRYYGNFKHYSNAISDNKSNGKIDFQSYADYETEGTKIADQIQSLIDNGEKLNEIAVLYRVNSQSIHIENELKNRKIDYEISGDSSFFKRKEIVGILSFLRLVQNPHDDAAFESIFNLRSFPLQFFSGNVMESIKRYAGLHNMSLYESLITMNYDKPWQKKNVKIFEDGIEKLRLQKDKHLSVTVLIDNIVRIFQIEDWIESKYTNKVECDDRLKSLGILKSFVKNNNLDQFITYVYSGNTKKKAKKNSVKLMSVHASKGLEFKNVFLIGIEDCKFPHERADLLEEARLFYVAVTRAKESLVISEIGSGNQFVMEYR